MVAHLVFGSQCEEHSFFLSPYHDCAPMEISKLYKFSEALEKMMDPASFCFCEMQTVEGRVLWVSFVWRLRWFQVAHRWQLLILTHIKLLFCEYCCLKGCSIGKKWIKVNLKKTSFYVDMVKIVRIVCKWLKVGKPWYKRKSLGLRIKICFGIKFRLCPSLCVNLGHGWFFLTLSLPEMWDELPQGHWALNQR